MHGAHNTPELFACRRRSRCLWGNDAVSWLVLDVSWLLHVVSSTGMAMDGIALDEVSPSLCISAVLVWGRCNDSCGRRQVGRGLLPSPNHQIMVPPAVEMLITGQRNVHPDSVRSESPSLESSPGVCGARPGQPDSAGIVQSVCRTPAPVRLLGVWSNAIARSTLRNTPRCRCRPSIGAIRPEHLDGKLNGANVECRVRRKDGPAWRDERAARKPGPVEMGVNDDVYAPGHHRAPRGFVENHAVHARSRATQPGQALLSEGRGSSGLAWIPARVDMAKAKSHSQAVEKLWSRRSVHGDVTVRDVECGQGRVGPMGGGKRVVSYQTGAALRLELSVPGLVKENNIEALPVKQPYPSRQGTLFRIPGIIQRSEDLLSRVMMPSWNHSQPQAQTGQIGVVR
ncbi:hypothetical protein CPLU01_06222 [Colletotrichum plurivorum]|uniref:Uncharacterized protein n=1 Tax=Colletotrichum plurivorum TaxID=2175906 RepID=A0A8H6NG65_9PEZI|nr:hypothetical protein CPLU01_06222 [Colletotrichum plurivorum]